MRLPKRGDLKEFRNSLGIPFYDANEALLMESMVILLGDDGKVSGAII